MPEDPSNLLIPFGKHRGKTVAELLDADPQYAEWLLTQAWLTQRYSAVHAALASRGATTDDTPEHNAMQMRFLTPLFRASCYLCLQDPALDRDRVSYVEAGIAHAFTSSAHFEDRGVDVTLHAGFMAEADIERGALPEHYIRGSWGIELKPVLSDDYPTVMRQMRRLSCNVLLIDQYVEGAVPLFDLCAMFQANHQRLLTMREVNDKLVEARRLLPRLEPF